MKELRKLIALLLVLMLVFTFTSCGSKDSGSNDDNTPDEQSQEIDQDDPNDLFDESDEELFDDPEDETADTTDTETDDEDEEEPEAPSAPGALTGDYTGEFGSNTGTSLNLTVKWAASEGDDGDYDVKLQFYLNCYSLHVGDRDANKLTIKTSSGSKDYSFKTIEVNRDDNSQDEVLIGETSIKLTKEELSSGAKAEASWDFRGSYSGQDLSVITAKGDIKGN